MEILKPNANHHALLPHFAPALLLLLLLLTANVQKAQCLMSTAPPAAEGGCNGTSRIADCLLPHGQEFLMESETSRRLLANANRPKTIAPLAQQAKRPFCDANVYGSCFPTLNKFYGRPHCTYTTCKRAPK